MGTQTISLSLEDELVGAEEALEKLLEPYGYFGRSERHKASLALQKLIVVARALEQENRRLHVLIESRG